MDASTATTKGRVTIPKAIRLALGIRQGSRIAFATGNGKVELRVQHLAPETVVSGHGMLDACGKRIPPDFDAASVLAAKRGGKR